MSLSRQLVLKPAFDLTLFASSDYIGPMVIVRSDVFKTLGGVDPAYGSAATFDLLLRALDQGFAIDRITEVLATYPDLAPKSDPQLRKQALTRSRTFGSYRVRRGATADLLSLTRGFEDYPSVTLLIQAKPGSKDQPQADRDAGAVDGLLRSLKGTNWPLDKLCVLIFGNSPLLSEERARDWPFKVTWVSEQEGHGRAPTFAEAMNRLWRAAETDLLVVLSEDVEITSPDWLQALMTFAMDEGVGGVGARLVSKRGALQHAGMIGGVTGILARGWYREPAHVPTYQDWAVSQREWSMVSGEVFATRKSLLEEVNGYDEAFSSTFNNVDLCLKLKTMGYRIVYNPDAELLLDTDIELYPPASGSDMSLLLRRWGAFLSKDPAYSPGLVHDGVVVRPKFEAKLWTI